MDLERGKKWHQLRIFSVSLLTCKTWLQRAFNLLAAGLKPASSSSSSVRSSKGLLFSNKGGESIFNVVVPADEVEVEVAAAAVTAAKRDFS